jgi:hypothetical protein
VDARFRVFCIKVSDKELAFDPEKSKITYRKINKLEI